MHDNPKIFDSLGKNPDFHEPVKQIHDFAGTVAFQKTVAMEHLVAILSEILKLVALSDCASELFEPNIVTRTDDDRKLHTPHRRENNEASLFISHYKSPQNQNEIFKKYLDDNISPNDNGGVAMVISLLEYLSDLADDTPPLPGPRRYGNFACRHWHQKFEPKMKSKLKELIVDSNLYVGPSPEKFIDEIQFYIMNSFGSEIRLDYGTGHELNFIAFLGCLWMSDVLINMTSEKFMVIFIKYYDLVRKLILNYTLEPAGSRGVWGLDDHFHIIYLLGAAQFIDSKNIVSDLTIGISTKLSCHTNTRHTSTHDSRNRANKHGSIEIPDPKGIMDDSVVIDYKYKNFYFNAIAFIKKVKFAPFWESSPILYDISGIRTWNKIFLGLKKMYNAEVLGKFPVVQHFWFGGVFYPWIEESTQRNL